MARGWESKSVEEQQSEFNKKSEKSKSPISAESRERADKIRALELKRARVLDQLKQSTNQRFTELMLQELAHLERQLAEINPSKT